MRFPEFSGEWEVTNLKKISTINPTIEKVENKFAYIDLESVTKGQLNKLKYLTKAEAPSRAQRVLKLNDILFQCVRPYQMNNYIVKSKKEGIQLVASTGYAQLRVEEDIPDFIFNVLNTPRFNKEAMIRCTGSSYPAINSEELSEIQFYKCSIQEQRKIADSLSLLDERIETQKKIIEDLKKLKKEISKRIFSKQINFSKQKFLGDICTITTGKLDANAMTKNGKYLFFTCAYENYKTDTYAFEGKALLISGNGEVGLVKKYNGKFNAYQRTYVLQNFIENMDYIKCYIEYFLPKRIQKEKNVGAMPYIVLSTLYDMNIAIPSIETQNQISKIIDTIINFIECEYDIQAKYELQKQFLLRRMFI